jgi:hypothetical protein
LRRCITKLDISKGPWPSTVPAKEETEFAPFKLEYLKKLNLNREQKKGK